MKAPQHLAHLPTDRQGRPVPWINIWGPEDVEDRLSIRYDRNVGRVCTWYADDPGAGPNFTRQSPQRQREAAYCGRCQVCRRPVDWPDRRLVISSVSVEVVPLRGRQVAVVTEPWLCPNCADFATTVCPALIRRSRADDLLVVAGFSQDACWPVLSEGWVDGPYEMATRREPVGMWVKLHVPAELAAVPRRRRAAS